MAVAKFSQCTGSGHHWSSKAKIWLLSFSAEATIQ